MCYINTYNKKHTTKNCTTRNMAGKQDNTHTKGKDRSIDPTNITGK